MELRKDAVGGGCSLLSPDVVLHLRDQALAVPADGDVRTRRLRMLDDVGKRLTDDEVGSRLHRGRWTFVDVDVDVRHIEERTASADRRRRPPGR